jgi:ankyrin repeat protein
MMKKGSTIIILSVSLSIWAACVSVVSEKPIPLQLLRAIAIGDVDALETIVKRDPSSVKSRDRDKRTPLHYCGQRPLVVSVGNNSLRVEGIPEIWLANSKVMAELLIAHGADVNARDVFSQTPLHLAAQNGNLEVAKVLLANNADVNAREMFNSTALHIVAWSGNTAFAGYLIEKGADVNAKDRFGTPLISAVEDHRDVVELLLNNKADVHMKSPDGFAPIHLAGKKEITQILFDHGAELEMSGYHGRTPLHQSAMRNRCDIVEWLCAKSVNVNAVDADSHTPLTIAISQPSDTEYAKKNSIETVRILLKYGADVNYRAKDGRTLLHDAIFRGREDLIDLVLKHGADINAKDKYGYTSLHWAVSNKNKKVVELLVDRGADVNARNLQGRTPLYDTWGGSSVEVQIADILIKHGGIK